MLLGLRGKLNPKNNVVNNNSNQGKENGTAFNDVTMSATRNQHFNGNASKLFVNCQMRNFFVFNRH